ncbi:uncharacterized protein LOC135693289 isoform X1 [Rhopilema esculentum]|uniref:uncharacterized protein LOC135693289 isoform X1 n=1 Tax=Rhopilema esculentum TaxID=499914 RepID=UPI0031D5766F
MMDSKEAVKDLKKQGVKENKDEKTQNITNVNKKKKNKAPRYWSGNKDNTKLKKKSKNDGGIKEVEEFVIDPEILEKYTRGQGVNVKDVSNKKLQSKLKSSEDNFTKASRQAARAELLLAEESGFLEADEMERTYKFTQKEISKSVDVASAAKSFELKLDKFGPYKVNYTRNGRFLLMGGQRGHLATIDWNSKRLGCEFHVQETVKDLKWLHQETLFAVAQKRNVYIYDNTGLEIHCLKKHRNVNRMEFLPYHFLLATVGDNGYLKYQDTSTGKMVAEHATRLGRCDCMTLNPYNAIINLGHANGTVTMWSPAVKEPLVKMFTHRGPVISMAVDKNGLYMATSGMDGLLKIWDIRSYQPLHAHRLHRAAHSLSLSQKGQLAVGFGPHVYVYKNPFTEQQKLPYMSHLIPSSEVVSLQFCPFEDILGVGHTKGFTSLLIPGSGEANFDAFEANPYETKKQRREHEVKMLLEKIQPELITLNPSEILQVGSAGGGNSDETETAKATFEPRFRTKGKGTTVKIHQRKKGMKGDSKREQIRKEVMDKKRKERQQKIKEKRKTKDLALEPKSTLERFTQKKT